MTNLPSQPFTLQMEVVAIESPPLCRKDDRRRYVTDELFQAAAVFVITLYVNDIQHVGFLRHLVKVVSYVVEFSHKLKIFRGRCFSRNLAVD